MADKSLRFLLFGEDRGAGKILEGIGEKSQSMLGKVGSGLTKLGGTIGGEVGELVSKVGEGFDQISEHAHGVGKGLMIMGGVATGVGIGLQLMASKDVAAHRQLQSAVEATGKSYEDYAPRIEEAIKSQENFGHSAVDTQNALRVLTAATNDPAKAIANMGLAADLAAAKHIGLADAAALIAKVYGGSGKALKAYGITLESSKVSTHQLVSAEKEHAAAIVNLEKAQKHLSDLEAIDAGKKKLTIADHLKLRDAHNAVTAAKERLRASTVRMTDAEKKATEATHASQEALDKLQTKLKGQAAASVDTFAGRLNIAKVKLEDWVASVGSQVGNVLNILGPTFTAAGFVIDSGLGKALLKGTVAAFKFVGGMIAAGAASIGTGAKAVWSAGAFLVTRGAMLAVSVATRAWAAGQWLLNVALTANPIGLVVAAIALLVVGLIYAWQHSQTFRTVCITAFNAVRAAFVWVVQGILGGIAWMLEGFGNMQVAIGNFISRIPGLGAVGHAIAAAGQMALNAAGAVRHLADSLNQIQPKTVTVTVYAQIAGNQLAISQLQGGSSGAGVSIRTTTKTGSISTRRAFAAGGYPMAGEPVTVGEHGPEIVTFGGGAHVHATGSTGGSGGTSITIQAGLIATPAEVARLVSDAILRAKGRGNGLRFS